MIFGATGMLGKSLSHVLQQIGIEVIEVTRNYPYYIDFILNSNSIDDLIRLESPDIVINCAAIVNLEYCEKNPKEAYLVNARAPYILSSACEKFGVYFVQISTDHYYNDKPIHSHYENEKITLLNEYAKTKFAGEAFTLINQAALVIRTNLVGFRNGYSPTFFEWIIKELEANRDIIGYTDFYTSSIDTISFSELLLKLINLKTCGIYNIAANDVISKYEFIRKVAYYFNTSSQIKKGKITNTIPRAKTLGLDNSKFIKHTGEIPPTSNEVINRLVNEYRKGELVEL